MCYTAVPEDVCDGVIVNTLLLILVDYNDAHRITCFRGVSRISLSVDGNLCATHLVPGSRLAVAIADTSTTTARRFGLSITGALDIANKLDARRSLVACVISGSKVVAFPRLKQLCIINVSYRRLRTCLIRGLRPFFSRSVPPVIATQLSGCHIAILNRMNDPGIIDISSRGVDILRTVTSTNSLNVCNGQGGILIVHRSTANRGARRILSLASTGVVGSPCCCIRRGSIVCIAPGGSGTHGSSVNRTAALAISVADVIVSLTSLLCGVLGWYIRYI